MDEQFAPVDEQFAPPRAWNGNKVDGGVEDKGVDEQFAPRRETGCRQVVIPPRDVDECEIPTTCRGTPQIGERSVNRGPPHASSGATLTRDTAAGRHFAGAALEEEPALVDARSWMVRTTGEFKLREESRLLPAYGQVVTILRIAE